MSTLKTSARNHQVRKTAPFPNPPKVLLTALLLLVQCGKEETSPPAQADTAALAAPSVQLPAHPVARISGNYQLPSGEISPCQQCFYRDPEGRYHAFPAIVQSAAPAAGNPKPVWLDSLGWGYLSEKAEIALVLAYDNGPDPFSEGLARFKTDGKMGFIDANLQVRIPATYEFASPFEGGRSKVGARCQERLVGEHRAVQCLHWSEIDLHGNAVKPASEPVPPASFGDRP